MNFPPAALNDGWIVAVIKLVESDHATAFDLKALASLAGHSPFHFQRRFREIMGATTSAVHGSRKPHGICWPTTNRYSPWR